MVANPWCVDAQSLVVLQLRKNVGTKMFSRLTLCKGYS